ncbi:MAG: VCBS repeat-containing protein [Barnesiella sp.]|nr:VCBS repeat-containing protein [Barnesiella sp.]
MKNFTKNAMLVAAAATALTASADATWQIYPQSADFIGVQGGRGIMADFTNNGHLDIYYSGNSWHSTYDHKGLWSWQCSSGMIINNGDGTYSEDRITTAPNGTFDENDLDDEGNPKEWWSYIEPKHGIAPTKWAHYATVDFNNDGLVDLLVSGIANGDDYAGFRDKIPQNGRLDLGDNKWAVTVLYKNVGDGRFEVVENCNLPIVVADDNNGESMFMKTVAWGDYDHDGYVDFAFSGLKKDNEPGEPGRVAQLWRNIDGTGQFEQMNIAETWGGTWTNAVTEGEGDEKVEVIPSRELEGWFLLLSGNVTMADINNDGWLDLVFDGWCDKVSDGIYEGGSNGRVYLNQEGKKFIDVTDRTGAFYLTRGGNTQLADFDGDGYLDLINAGYGDHNLGWKTLLFYNNNSMGDINPEETFDYGNPMGSAGLPDEETMSLVVRDFDGDDVLDILYVGKQDGAVYYGDFSGNFNRSANFAIRGFDARDGHECFGDLTGNGLVDRFQTGYSWLHDNAEMDGVDYRGMLNGGGDWAWARWLWHNTTDIEIEAPDTPANVTAAIDEEAKTITVKWEDADNLNCAYNVVVVTPSGKVIANLPVDPVTGFIKVAENKNIAIRPYVNEYTLPYNEAGLYKVGVQTVSLNNEKASAINWAPELSGVGTITSDIANTTVKVTVNGNTIVANADANADVKVVDMMGRTIATGVTNTPINVEANGVLIVTAAGQSVKVVK